MTCSCSMSGCGSSIGRSRRSRASTNRSGAWSNSRGIGPLVGFSALYALVGDGRQYRSGRELAVALGLTPRQHSSGGKEKLLGISKRGDKYVRTLLIHGARSALRVAPGKTDRLSRWAVALAERSHPNVAVTALANKMARVAWAMLRHGTNYEPEHVAA